MTPAVIVSLFSALLSSGITLAGVLIANGRTQGIMEAKIEELTREVRAHNDFARRVPVLEEQIRNMGRRLDTLERSK